MKKILKFSLIILSIIVMALIIPVTAADNPVNLWITLPDGTRVIGEITPAEPCYDDTITFNSYIVPDTGTLSLEWYFGDNTFSSLPNTTHSYADPGTYSVCLIATAESGDEYTGAYDNYVVKNRAHEEIIPAPTPTNTPSQQVQPNHSVDLKTMLTLILLNTFKTSIDNLPYDSKLTHITVIDGSSRLPIEGVWVNLTYYMWDEPISTQTDADGVAFMCTSIDTYGLATVQDDYQGIDLYFIIEPNEVMYIVMA